MKGSAVAETNSLNSDAKGESSDSVQHVVKRNQGGQDGKHSRNRNGNTRSVAKTFVAHNKIVQRGASQMRCVREDNQNVLAQVADPFFLDPARQAHSSRVCVPFSWDAYVEIAVCVDTTQPRIGS